MGDCASSSSPMGRSRGIPLPPEVRLRILECLGYEPRTLLFLMQSSPVSLDSLLLAHWRDRRDYIDHP